jgi:hypothetical protein
MKWAFAVSFLIASLLLSCAPQPADPSVAIENLKATCNAACAGTQVTNVTMPSGWSLVATKDGLCLKKNVRLLCGTCACGTYGFIPTELLPAGDERVAACTFTGDADARTLIATCA